MRIVLVAVARVEQPLLVPLLDSLIPRVDVQIVHVTGAANEAGRGEQHGRTNSVRDLQDGVIVAVAEQRSFRESGVRAPPCPCCRVKIECETTMLFP